MIPNFKDTDDVIKNAGVLLKGKSIYERELIIISLGKRRKHNLKRAAKLHKSKVPSFRLLDICGKLIFKAQLCSEAITVILKSKDIKAEKDVKNFWRGYYDIKLKKQN